MQIKKMNITYVKHVFESIMYKVGPISNNEIIVK